MDKGSLATIKPLFLGRLGRVLFGIATFGLVGVIGVSTLGVIGTVALIFLGTSFLVGGIVGNPGCEITALPNLLMPEEKRVHCM